MTQGHSSNDQTPHQNNGFPQQQQEPPLTDRELRELREIMEADRRVKWLWATIRRVAIWIGAVGGALVVTWEWLVKAVRHIAGS